MRIRKRWPPLSLPPSTPLPRPDHSSSESRELHQRHDLSPEDNKNPTPLCDPPNQYLSPPREDESQRRRSDLHLVTVSRTDGWICTTGGDVDVKIDSMHLSFNKDPPIGVGEGGVAEENRLTAANRSFGYNPSPETSAVIGHWCEEDKAIPLKKRRVILETKMEEEKKNKTKVRVRGKRKQNWDESEDDKEEEKDWIARNDANKRESGSTKMGGSRCSRINGRGWRCCQQTLVGYSLCEHHLGKGRVRSMSTSVRSRSRTAPSHKPNNGETSSHYEEEEEEVDNDVEKGSMVVKKRNKIGVVKARSMSSLLGQTVPLQPVTLQWR